MNAPMPPQHAGPALKHEVREITPAEAEQILQKTRNVSALDHRQVATYARDMAEGAWKLNGDPVILDQDNVLLSGRLRLHACMKAQAAFPTLIIYNVDPEHFDTIDAVRRRRVADIMSIRREKNGRALAAALAVLWRFANNDFEAQSKKISSQALVAILEENPDIRFSVTAAQPASPRIATGLGAALHFMFSRVDSAKADAFFADLADDDIAGKSATSLLKRQLDNGRAEGGRRNQVQLAGLVIKAWEAYRSGRPIALVRFALGTDQFPKISGMNSGVRFDGVRHSSRTTEPSLSPNTRNLTVRVEVITPDRAQQILDRNDRNRAIAAAVVDKYARDMKSGAWALNGQTIKIGESGRLLDGQHRCAACVRSNTPFPAIIVEGLDDEVFDTFDLGTRRSVSDLLRDRGETNTAVTAAVLRHVWLLENGFATLRTVSPTINELMQTLEMHPGVRNSVHLSGKVRDVAPSVALALHYFFCRVDEEKADEFIERLGDGVMLGADSPVLKLRDVLLEDRANRKRRLSDAEKAALIIKSWNAFIEGKPMRVLKWANAGERKEAFPAIVGTTFASRAA